MTLPVNMDEVHRYPAAPCPTCGRPNDAASAANGGPSRPPGDGDLSVCFRCGALAIYQATAFGMILRAPTPDEQAAALLRPDVVQARAKLIEFWNDHPHIRDDGN